MFSSSFESSANSRLRLPSYQDGHASFQYTSPLNNPHIIPGFTCRQLSQEDPIYVLSDYQDDRYPQHQRYQRSRRIEAVNRNWAPNLNAPCPGCDKRFSSVLPLASHLSQHTGEKHLHREYGSCKNTPTTIKKSYDFTNHFQKYHYSDDGMTPTPIVLQSILPPKAPTCIILKSNPYKTLLPKVVIHDLKQPPVGKGAIN